MIEGSGAGFGAGSVLTDPDADRGGPNSYGIVPPDPGPQHCWNLNSPPRCYRSFFYCPISGFPFWIFVWHWRKTNEAVGRFRTLVCFKSRSQQLNADSIHSFFCSKIETIKERVSKLWHIILYYGIWHIILYYIWFINDRFLTCINQRADSGVRIRYRYSSVLHWNTVRCL